MTTADALATFSALPDVVLLPDSQWPEFSVDGVDPLAVVCPQTEAATSAVVRSAAAAGLPVLPWGGGTAVSLGNRLTAKAIVIDLSGLNRLIEYQPRDRTITVEAGMTMATVAELVEAEGQLLPLEPPLPHRATVGGTLAAGLSGPRRYRYGAARDLLIGSRAVLADGTLVHAGGRVAKNVAGYDLNKLWIGSAGTLAILTAATFRLWPAPPTSELAVMGFPSAEAAHAMAMTVAGSTLQPLTLDIAGPDALAGTPANLADPWLLCVENGGTPAMVERQRGELRAIAATTAAAQTLMLGGQDARTVLGALRDFGYPATFGMMLLRAAVLPSRTAAACSILSRLPGSPALVARAGNGLVYTRWLSPLPDTAGLILEEARAAITALGGTVAIQHALAEVKGSHDAWGLSGADVTLMERIKDAYDPNHLLSPGRAPGSR